MQIGRSVLQARPNLLCEGGRLTEQQLHHSGSSAETRDEPHCPVWLRVPLFTSARASHTHMDIIFRLRLSKRPRIGRLN
ncbi:hypothetical protein E2C01_097525 [Portunus trituberculatus]|uniref:Uncharacterized protein n=1 Tax=Portunus trituberculatus TaxID=210409 RepID=A0A5B7JVE8_PORTR|nr:hypothetical protein [Portunus trituberculatus]